MKKSALILILFFRAGSFFSQNPGQTIASAKRYTQGEVLDSAGGIDRYTRLMSALGGDSAGSNGSGFILQGWNEDFYTSGKLLHRGYYVDGKLITFKNFFESGQCERSVESPDPVHCVMSIFFENGSPRKQINYYNGLPQKLYEYYENGQPRLAEENEKEMKYLTLKKSWYDNGHLQSHLELVDLKNKRYNEKNYYLNGQLREEGTVILLSGTQIYVKDGTWHCYDSNGKNKRSERHNKGIKLNSRQ